MELPRTRKKSVRDFVVFFCLTAFIVAHFLLQDFPNTEFYLVLMILSLVGLMWLKHYHKDWEFPFDFDENLSFQKWIWVIGGVVAIYGISAFFAGISTPTGQFDPVIFIPMFGYAIYYLGAYQLPTYINDMLFNITLVSPAEELCKLVSTTALFLFLGRYFIDKRVNIGISVGIPNFFWAILHVYKNPAYIGNYWFVASAFCSGLILYVVLWKTQSILASILSHGLYNCAIVFLLARGILVVPTT